MLHPPRRAPALRALAAAAALAIPTISCVSSHPPALSQHSRAFVRVPIEAVVAAPAPDASVTTQATLGTTVDVLESSAPSETGFAKIRTPDGYVGWIPAAALRAAREGDPNYGSGARGGVLEVTSVLAHLYREPSFERAKPWMTVSMGTRLEADARAESRPGEAFHCVSLPGGERAYVAAGDARGWNPNESPASRPDPASWVALGRRLLGAPYTWGGTTPEGFDCSGLIQFILRRHGVQLRRDAYQQCFQDPRLVPVQLDRLEPGDLLFFGTDTNISHVAMWIGEGSVLESSRAGTPCAKIGPLDSPALKPNFRYARRLRELAGAAPAADTKKAASLETDLLPIVLEAGGKEKQRKIAVVFAEIGGPRLSIAGDAKFPAGAAGEEIDAEALARRLEARAPADSQQSDGAIAAGIHSQSGARVEGSSASSATALRDADLVTLPDGRRYVLVVIVGPLAGAQDQQKADATIRRISRVVWDFMIAPQ
jgi:cell wall-associated NlpC family hydrolase